MSSNAEEVGRPSPSIITRLATSISLVDFIMKFYNVLKQFTLLKHCLLMHILSHIEVLSKLPRSGYPLRIGEMDFNIDLSSSLCSEDILHPGIII